MPEAEGINCRVGLSSGGDRPKGPANRSRSFRHNNPNLEDVLNFIRGLSVTDSDKETLEKTARRVPHGALAKFRDNYMNYISRGR